LAQRRKKTEGQPGDPVEWLSSLSLEARKLSEALLSSNRPSAGVVQSVEKLQELITLFAQNGELVKIKDNESAALRIAMDELPEQLRHHCDHKGIQVSGAFPDFIFDGIVYLCAGFCGRNTTSATKGFKEGDSTLCRTAVASILSGVATKSRTRTAQY
jgi:hypothetical protein